MNILGVGPYPPRGGGDTMFFDALTRGLAERGHRVHVLAQSTAQNIESCRIQDQSRLVAVTRYSTPLYEYGRRVPEDVESMLRWELPPVRELLPKLNSIERADLVLIGHEFYSWFVPELVSNWPIPCVLLARGTPTWRMVAENPRWPDSPQWLNSYARCDQVITVSKNFETGLRRQGLSRVTHIPNIVDLTKFRPAHRNPNLASKVGITSENVVVLHPSLLQDRKRPLDIVRSAPAVLAEDERVVYVVVGSGHNLSQMKALCAELSITEHFRFIGLQPYDVMPRYYNLADIIVMPSQGEGLSRVYLEAQACGRTLVASDIPASREVIEHGETGLLFELGNIEDLSEQVLAAAGDSKLRGRIGHKSLKRIQSNDCDRILDLYADTLNDVVRRHASTLARIQ